MLRYAPRGTASRGFLSPRVSWLRVYWLQVVEKCDGGWVVENRILPDVSAGLVAIRVKVCGNGCRKYTHARVHGLVVCSVRIALLPGLSLSVSVLLLVPCEYVAVMPAEAAAASERDSAMHCAATVPHRRMRPAGRWWGRMRAPARRC